MHGGCDLKLTRFGGATQAYQRRLHDAQDMPTLLTCVPPADGRSGPSRTLARGPFGRVRADGAADQRLGCAGRQAGGPPGGQVDGLSVAEREELARPRRENKQLRLERDILSRAAAWFVRARAPKEIEGAVPSGSSGS